MHKTFALLLACLPLAACGGQDQSATTTTAAPAASEATTDTDANAAAGDAAMPAPTPGSDLQLVAYRDCIAAVLQRDAQAANPDPGTQVSQMRQIDTSACPTEFRTAYYDHTLAWEKMSRVQRAWKQLNSEDNKNTTLAASAIATLLELDATPFKDHVEAEQRLHAFRSDANAEISDTFHRVERIALEYGVTNTWSS